MQWSEEEEDEACREVWLSVWPTTERRKKKKALLYHKVERQQHPTSHDALILPFVVVVPEIHHYYNIAWFVRADRNHSALQREVDKNREAARRRDRELADLRKQVLRATPS